MKTIILALLLILPALAYAEPSIQFESQTHDFGEVQQGVQLEHTFEFENAGTEDLIIKQVAPS